MMSSTKPPGGMMSSMMPGGGMMTTAMKPHGHHMKEPFELDQIMFNYDMQSVSILRHYWKQKQKTSNI